jgi:hypothetical protein
MEDWNLHGPAQFFLNKEALGRLDVFQVDTAERRFEKLAGADDLSGIFGGQFNIENVDIGKPFEQNAFASMTGLPACAPILPRPSTAVPLLTTATRLPLAVYL